MNTITKEAQNVKLESAAREKLTGGLEAKKVVAMLVLDYDCSLSAAQKAVKDAGGVTAKKSFASEFYDWLAVEPRTEGEVEDYINGHGEYGETSSNVKNHLSHYKAIADLASRIWEK